MNIKQVFKNYPKNEPDYIGINYLTIIMVDGHPHFSFTYFNDACEFEPKRGSVIAFSNIDPAKILENL